MNRRLVLVAAAIALASLVVAADPARAQTPVSGTISTDTVWTYALSPYLVTGDITVAGFDGADGVTKLTIEPGVVVRFMPGTRLSIGDGLADPGALAANASEILSITFTSAASTPAAGDWVGIVFTSTADDDLSFVQGALVEYAGAGATGLVHAIDSAPTIADNTLRHSAGYGVLGDGRWAAPRVGGNAFFANALAPVLTSPWGAGSVDANAWSAGDRIEISHERLEASTTWDDAGAPFHVAERVVVAGESGPGGATTLTIGENVTVEMGPGAGFEVGECCDYTGALETTGTAAAPVLFTSDQPAGSKTPGYWGRIHFYGASYDAGSILRNATFEYGGANGRGMVHANASAPSVHGGAFRHSSGYGLYAEGNGAYPSIEGATFEDNAPAHARLLPDGVRLVEGNSFSYAQDVEVLSGNLGQDSLWTNQGAAYRLTGTLTVSGSAGPDLTTGLELGPGVEVRFPAAASLSTVWWSGHLNASGTPEAPVLLTSVDVVKAPGQWRGLALGNYANRGHVQHLVVEAAGGGATAAVSLTSTAPAPFENVTIDRSGAHGLYLDCPVSPNLTDVRIVDATQYGLYDDSGSGCAPALTRVTIERAGGRAARLHMDTPRDGLILVDNAIEEIEIYRTSTSILANTTLELRSDRDTASRYAYNLLTSIVVQNDSVLTIEPGVTTRWASFAYLQAGLCCSSPPSYRGTLVARGTEELPIVFEAANDSSRWSGVYLEGYALSPDPEHDIANATFSRSRDDGLHLRRVTAGTYDNVTLANNTRYGLYLDDTSTTTWRSLTTRDNLDSGIYVGSGSVPAFYGLLAERNGNYGLFVASTSASATVEGGIFREQTGRPARVRLGDRFLPVELRSNGIAQVELLVLDLYANATIPRLVDAVDGTPYAYRMTGGFTVRNSATLTLEPGVTVLWPSNAALNVGICCSNGAIYLGRIVAHGTQELPIVLDTVDPANRWYGLYLEGYGTSPDANHDLANLTIMRSRDDGLHMRRMTAGEYDNLTLRDNTRFGLYLESLNQITMRSARFLDNGDIGVYEDGSSSLTLDTPLFSGNRRWAFYGSGSGDVFTVHEPTIENTIGRPWRARVDALITAPRLSNNSVPEIEFWGLVVSRNVTLTRYVDETTGATYSYAGVTYTDVRNNLTMTVEPGVTVRFDDNSGIRFGTCCTAGAAHQGALLAEGTEDLPIRFLNRTPTTTSAWNGLEIDGSVTAAARNPSILRNVTVEGSRYNGLHVIRMHVGTFDNVTFDNNLHSGVIFNVGATATVTNLVARNNAQYGNLRLVDDAKVTVNGALLVGGGDYGVSLQNDNTYLTLRDAQILDSAQYGIFAGGAWGGGASLTNVAIEGSGGRPWRMNAWSVLHNVTLADNAILDLEWTRSDVQGNRTWPLFVDGATGSFYNYTARDLVRFYENGTLTIEPGVNLTFVQNAYMDIGWCCYNPATRNRAGLVAEGTEALPIRFVAQTGSAATGWYGLLLHGQGVAGDMPVILRNATLTGSKDDAIQVHEWDNAILDNVTLGQSLRFGLYASSANGPTVTNLLVEDTANHGIYTDGNAFVNLSGGTIRRATGYGVYHANGNLAGRYAGLTIEDSASYPLRVRLDTDLAGLALDGNAQRRIELYAVDVAVDRTLPLAMDPDGSAYAVVLLNSFTIHTGAKLTVPAGSTVLMPTDARLLVGRCCNQNSLDPGALIAAGTQSAPITFGTTAPNKTTGWRGLYFDGRSNYGELASVLRNVTVRDSRADLIEVYGHASVTLDHLRLLNTTSSAIWAHGAGRVNVTDSVFDGGLYGLYSQDNPTVFTDNDVSNYTTHAMYLERAHGSTIERNALSTLNGTTVRLNDNDNSALRANRITGGAIGVRIETSSTGNTLTNNLLRNTQNALDLASSTAWSQALTVGENICRGPTLGGNCWSDYAGIDNTGDGIGDTLVPYKVNITGAGDLAPLVIRPFADFASVIVDADDGIVSFTDLSTDPVHPIVNWTWEFDDGQLAYEQNPTHDYNFEGLFLVRLTITDAGGNSANATHSVLLDSIPPLTTGLLSGNLGQAGWWVSNVSVTLDAEDNESVVDRVLYRLNGVGNFSTYAAPVELGADGTHLVEYFAVDIGGNTEPVRSLNVSIDQTTPITDATLAGALHAVGWYTSNVSATLAAADATSGLDAIYYRLNGSEALVYGAAIAINGTGVHTLEPLSADVAGNLETAIPRLVRIDLTPPVSSVLVTNGTPGENGWWRSAVDVGVAGADAGAGVATLAMGIDGAPAAPYATPVNVATEGVHTVAHQATDLVDLVEALRQSVVKLDLTAPNVGVDLAGDLHPSGWYRTPVVAFVNATDATSGLNATEYRLDAPGFVRYVNPVTIDTTGTHTLQARATDLAGNLVNGLTLNPRVDVNAPTTSHAVISGTHGTSHWYRSNVVSRLTAGDGLGSGVSGTSFALDGTPMLPYVGDITILGEGLHRVNATSTDVVGHVEGLKTFLVGIDVTAPSTQANVTGLLNPETGAYYGPTTVRLAALDALSGVHRIDYWKNGVGPTTYTSAGIPLATSGVYNLTFRALDLALNAEPMQYLNLTLNFDVTPPVTTATLTGVTGTSPWYRSPVNVTLVANDIGAGVGFIEYRLSNASDWTSYEGTFTIAQEGLSTLQFRALDLVGNTEATKLLTFGVDMTPPVAVASVDGPVGANGWYSGPVDVTLAAGDLVSRVASFQYRNNNGTWVNVPSVLRLDESGVHALEWLAVDMGGNVAGGTAVIKVDFDLPTAAANVTGPAGLDSWFRGNVTIALNASDPTSGVSRIDYSLDAGAWTEFTGPLTLATEGNHSLLFRPFDLVGNVGLITELNVKIDLTSPVLNLTLDNGFQLIIDETIIVRERLCFHIDTFDVLSGLNEVTIHILGIVEKIIVLDVGVNFQCVELPDGDYELRCVACDISGLCKVGGWFFKVDNGPPLIDLIRPSPGSVMVQNVSAPVFRSLFGQNRTALYAEAEGLPDLPDLPDAGDLPVTWTGWPEASPLTDPRDNGSANVTFLSRNDTLARTTVVVGPRVPIWIAAYDTSGVADVDFLLDGRVIGTAKRSEEHQITTLGVTQRNILDENGPVEVHLHQKNYTVYVLTIDTFRLVAGEHAVTMRARDILGSESSATFNFVFESQGQGQTLAERMAAAIDRVDVPAEAMPWRDFARDSLSFILPRIDEHLRDEYVFLDEGLLEFEGVWDPVVAAPGVAVEDDWGRI